MTVLGDASVLITGGTGFIGGALARNLTEEGGLVELLTRRSSVFDDRYRRVDDPGTALGLRDGLDGRAFATCFHLATHFVAQHTVEDVDQLIESNIALGLRVADALSGRTPPVVFVNVGTAWQHAGSAAYSPTSLYAATKQALQDLLQYYDDQQSLRVVNVKLFDTYGEHDTRRKLVSVLLDAARTGAQLQMSPGEQLVDLLHVDDVIGGLKAAAAAPPGSGQRFALQSGLPTTVRGLAHLVEQISGRPLNIDFGARPYRPLEMFERWDAGPRPPGWKPMISIEEGLRRLWLAT